MAGRGETGCEPLAEEVHIAKWARSADRRICSSVLGVLLFTACLTIRSSVGPAAGAGLSGIVRDAEPPADPLPNARVTLYTPSLSLFFEDRTGVDGSYLLTDLPPGDYRLGCCARNFEYVQMPVSIGTENLQRNFDLGPETQIGRWDIIGNTEPEVFDATDIGILLRNGTILYCHDTVDPINFDPATGLCTPVAGSSSEQGCMNGSLLPDGRVIMVGGQDGDDPGDFRNAIPWVKAYSRVDDAWEQLADLRLHAGRWYPGMARLADGSFLVMGGGTAPNAERTNTCERFDLPSLTWRFTGSMLNPCEFPPSALLFTGEVLATWWPPQLYNPLTDTWRATGNFSQPNRFWPGHSDHSLCVMADGRAIAVGVVSGPDGNGVMGEFYDPISETWSRTSNPGLVRFQSEVVQLPDGRILAAGGETEASPPPVENVLGIVKWSDLYDPIANTWRRVADLNWFREYHAVTLLLPDGRVATTGGTRIKFQYGPTSNDIEGFVPPYLLRGVRPEIVAVSSTRLARGSQVMLEIAPATALTSVVLMGTGTTTHWVDCGVPRRLLLPFQQVGTSVTATLPIGANILPLGDYLLFAMVDDIPSVARIVQVVEALIDSPESPENSQATTLVLSGSPNPGYDGVTLRFTLERETNVSLSIFDVVGRLVCALYRGLAPAGRHELRWDGLDGSGVPVPAGIYVATLVDGMNRPIAPAVKLVVFK